MEWINNHQWFVGSLMLIATIVGKYFMPRLYALWVAAEINRLAIKADGMGFGSEFRDVVIGTNLMPGDATRIYGRLRDSFGNHP